MKNKVNPARQPKKVVGISAGGIFQTARQNKDPRGGQWLVGDLKKTMQKKTKKEKIEVKQISSFPKIFHIGESFISNLFEGKVEISEKIDGSQWDFGITDDGEIVFRSKGEELTYKDVPKMFEKAKEQVERLTPILKKNFRDVYFYCEFLASPNHNILKYKRVPRNYLYLFGVMEGKNFVEDYKKLWKYADLLEIERVNILDYTEIKDVKKLEKYLKEKSILGNEKVEGIVVKNYNQPSGKGGFLIPISMGKYVREDFKERHQKEWKHKFTSKGKLELLIESFYSEARWHKAVQHLKEKGELENTPRDIGKLMEEIEKDLIEEEKENIKEELYKIFIKDITRRAKRGFPEWYKKQLLKKAFKK